MREKSSSETPSSRSMGFPCLSSQMWESLALRNHSQAPGASGRAIDTRRPPCFLLSRAHTASTTPVRATLRARSAHFAEGFPTEAGACARSLCRQNPAQTDISFSTLRSRLVFNDFFVKISPWKKEEADICVCCVRNPGRQNPIQMDMSLSILLPRLAF